jgi:hypothetical protein
LVSPTPADCLTGWQLLLVTCGEQSSQLPMILVTKLAFPQTPVHRILSCVCVSGVGGRGVGQWSD